MQVTLDALNHELPMPVRSCESCPALPAHSLPHPSLSLPPYFYGPSTSTFMARLFLCLSLLLSFMSSLICFLPVLVVLRFGSS